MIVKNLYLVTGIKYYDSYQGDSGEEKLLVQRSMRMRRRKQHMKPSWSFDMNDLPKHLQDTF